VVGDWGIGAGTRGRRGEGERRPGEGAGLEDGLAGEVGLVGVEVGAERARQARERREHLGVGSPRRVGGGGFGRREAAGNWGSGEAADARLVRD
jgi:hypothetical protein